MIQISNEVNIAYEIVCKGLSESIFNGKAFHALQKIIMPEISKQHKYILELKRQLPKQGTLAWAFTQNWNKVGVCDDYGHFITLCHCLENNIKLLNLNKYEWSIDPTIV